MLREHKVNDETLLMVFLLTYIFVIINFRSRPVRSILHIVKQKNVEEIMLLPLGKPFFFLSFFFSLSLDWSSSQFLFRAELVDGKKGRKKKEEEKEDH